MHFPVLREEAIHYLAVQPEVNYADVTTGLGGHSAEIAARLTTGRLAALDRDEESLEMARANLAPWRERIIFRRARFSELETALAGIGRVDGLLADLGLSLMHLKTAERGFSFQLEGGLDMRMSRSEGIPTAADIVNFSSEKHLAEIFEKYSEERRFGRRVARALVRARPVRTTFHLVDIIESVVPRTGRLHPATLFFQALRMAVNNELEELDALLGALPLVVKAGGRVVVLSYHSLEDRRVKRAMKEMAQRGIAQVLTRHVVRPAREEVMRNPPSRSAKLRAIEMV